MKAKSVLWKESASLIVLAKDKRANKKFNYNVLMFNRSEKTSFMPNHAVFPGGATESVDESVLWMKYLKKFGIQDQFLKYLTVVHGPRSGIFKKSGPNTIEKEISLRITALRETFEEVGLFLCRKKDNLNFNDNYGSFTEKFDRTYWQNEVHNDPAKFLDMCQELDVVPDLWSLSEWSAWLTPAAFNKRFETAFYLVALNEQPNLLCNEHEVTECLWKNPGEYFEAYNQGEVWLPPPQCYELARLAKEFDMEKVQKFASARNSVGTTVFLPVNRIYKDGMAGILPGDDEYPENPNECLDIMQFNESLDANFTQGKKCHRILFYTGTNQCRVVLNFAPLDGHLHPLDIGKIDSKM